MRRYRIGIDVGGTFTDLALWTAGQGIETFKVLSTPGDPSVGVIEGLGVIAAAHELSVRDFAGRIDAIVHGTTVTTNAVLTRGGARSGLITTEGVRDALEMRRGIRERQYDNRYPNVVPLVPRRLRLPVRGRLDWRGEELDPLDEADVRSVAEVLGEEGIEAVAICFMNAFANPAHERAAAAIVGEVLPEAFVSVSSSVLPTIRFYDRVSTTVLNAYVGPVLRDYLDNLTAKLAETGFGGVLIIMQSNGGVALPEATIERPALTLLSGPAAGPRAAVAFAGASGSEDCILMDMGGTSFDASLVRGGAAEVDSAGEIDRLRAALPMLAIDTIGAGGGSIGRVDEGGLLRMGPASAGALPGPACYGRGGERPTCTDANVVLGYLDPEFFAGGKLRLDAEAARAAIRAHVAEPLGVDVEEAAAGMSRVINANMAHGVRRITVSRGLDPREFPMVVAGGAGGLHACMIARELEIPTILVPGPASTLCAVGMLLCDLQHDFVRSCVGPLARIGTDRLALLVSEMVEQGERELTLEGAETIRHETSFDLRYLKQYHEVTVPVPLGALETGDLTSVADAFHAEHDRLYGYNLREDGTGLELINIRVRSVGATERPPLPLLERGDSTAAPAIKAHRRAFVPELGELIQVPVYDGHALRAGERIAGPALVERTDTTILVSASFDAEVDDHGTVVLRRQLAESSNG